MTKVFNAIDINDFVRGTGIKERYPVATISKTNVNLATDLAGASIGGLTVSADDRVLLIGQTTTTENGVYVITAGAGNTTRAPDFETGDNVASTYITVRLGTYANTVWQATGTSAIVGTDSLGFKMSTNISYTTGNILYGGSDEILKLTNPVSTSFLQSTGSTPSWVTGRTTTVDFAGKAPCRVESLLDNDGVYNTGTFTGVDFTSNTLFNLNAYTVQVGDRILVKNQTNLTENGIYVVSVAGATGSMSRASDILYGGDYVFVANGDGYSLTGSGLLTFDTDNIVWSKFSTNTYIAGNGINISSFTISAKLKTNGGIEIQSTELALNLGATSITGVLAVSNGGTGANTLSSGALILGNGTSAVNTLAPSNYTTLVVNGSTTYTLSNTIYASTISDSAGLTSMTLSSAGTPGQWLNIASSASDTNVPLTIAGTGTNAGISITCVGTGSVNFLGNATRGGSLRLFENSTNGSNYVELKTTETLASNLSFLLPSSMGTTGDLSYLSNSGTGALGFISPTSLNVKINMSVSSDAVLINSTSFNTICYITYSTARYGSASSCSLLYNHAGGISITLEVFDVTNNTSLASDTGTLSAFGTLAFTAPTTDARLIVRAKKTSGGANDTFYGIQLGIY